MSKYVNNAANLEKKEPAPKKAAKKTKTNSKKKEEK